MAYRFEWKIQSTHPIEVAKQKPRARNRSESILPQIDHSNKNLLDDLIENTMKTK